MNGILKNELRDFLASGGGLSSLCGVEPGALSLEILRMVSQAGKPVIALLPELGMVERSVEEIRQLCELTGNSIDLLCVPECGSGKLLFPEQESRRARALDALCRHRFDLALGSVNAMLAPAPLPGEIAGAALTLKPGMKIALEELVEKLVKLDYDDEYEASVTGEFARRGGIIDVFSPAADFPCRVEFFGDEIDSLRKFSPQTRRSTGVIDRYEIIGRAGITAGGAASGDAFNYLEPEKMILLRLYPEQGIERLKKYASGKAPERYREVSEAFQKHRHLFDFFDSSYAGGALSAAEALPALIDSPGVFSREVRNGAGELTCQLLRKVLGDRQECGSGVCFVAGDREDLPLLKKWVAQRFPELSAEFEISPLNFGFTLENLAVLTIRELVRAGFTRPGGTEAELPEPAPELSEKTPPVPEFTLADLDEGDYCVHLDHGIGIYRGLKSLTERGGVRREAMAIEYQDGQILYVPLLQACKVSRYLGAPGTVHLHKLGAGRWSKDKENARKGVRSYAADMLKLRAMRENISGFAFAPDNAGSRAFLRAFPFTDTPDQRRSTSEIRRDMESSKPMDRLLCGDVGYGKTEVAMRAVFKAVMSGKQAAVLAPTTVLVQQHFQSFRERFAEFPFNIEILSRFRTQAEQSDILRRLAEGKIDVIIGTHRLCGGEVQFKDLGLVVIDEEQRFGVNHKERLLRFRAEVDVLTMSATPIPRTLYLAMAGARDLSTLMTAPKQRLPVRTVIAPEEPELIVQAIRSELARGGQVYYLHNRVATIEEKAAVMRSLLPEARIAVAHGQMQEGELEKVMTDFIQKKIDCLICSTIIESGLDVPNANTIIIERADKFGLAELYQLRGRVGRWKRQAYAYLLLPRSQLVSSDARKRLAAIRRCSTLGAGFQLALHDLEIRGAGNILGSEQSGHLNSIGFDLYCQLLKMEVANLRGEKRDYLPEVELALDFVSFSVGAPAGMIGCALPPEYIGGERLRIDAYRRLSAVSSLEELESFKAELIDRFGPLPPEAKNLIDVIRLRLLSAIAGYTLFSVAEGKVLLRNPGGTVYRENGKVPVLELRDPIPLRMVHLLAILKRAAANTLKFQSSGSV